MNWTFLNEHKMLMKCGKSVGREGMSQLVIDAVKDWHDDGSTYKGAMILAGRLKTIARMAACDEYWKEQVNKGADRQVNLAKQELNKRHLVAMPTKTADRVTP